MTQENEHDIESMKEALSKANNEAASFRHQLNEAKAELEQAHSSANEYKSSYVDAKITAKLAEWCKQCEGSQATGQIEDRY
ncbi:hypothetical protein ACETU7_06475 [Rhodococcus sp. 3Y1]